MSRTRWCWLALLTGLAVRPGSSQDETDLGWWREARFGMFVHWGPVSLLGTEIGWSRGGERRGRDGIGSIPMAVYDTLYHSFHPAAYNADEWVRIAQAAGMKYLVLTTKHHDGFCLFDSELTEYKVTNSPIGRDLVAELADACHRAGMRLGFYYSQPDWHHPDYRTDRHDAYIEYLHGQLRELCSNYGKVDVIWFDGLGGTADDWRAEELCGMIRDLQPGVIINNRCGLRGDFSTPEQQVGAYDLTRPWESCITIGRQWAWRTGDQLKSPTECLRTLLNCAGGDGNLLFNVGPMPTGVIEPRQVERLSAMGQWLERHGEAVYGTRGGPLPPGAWGASTRRGQRLYLHLFDLPDEGFLLPVLPAEITAATLLSGGDVVCEKRDNGWLIQVPVVARDPHATVVALDLDRDAMDLPTVAMPIPGAVSVGASASASNVYLNQVDRYGPDKAVDGDPSTRWATDVGTETAWLELDLGKPTTFAGVLVKEYDERVGRWTIEVPDGEGWLVVFAGRGMGSERQFWFEPATAQRVRVSILEASLAPTIYELQLLAPREQSGQTQH